MVCGMERPIVICQEPAAYIRLIGISGTVIWVHGGCCHGSVRAKPLGGAATAHLMVEYFVGLWFFL